MIQRIFIRGVYEQLYEIEADSPKQAYEKFLYDSFDDCIQEIEDQHWFVCSLEDEDLLKLKSWRPE